MILEMDLGNTRTKWRLRDEEQIVLRGAEEKEKGFIEIKNWLQDYIPHIHSIWVASVMGEEGNGKLKSWVNDNFDFQPIFAQSQSQAAGVVNGYNKPRLLGVDRWLAIVAAYHLSRSACVVVSCGTAMTVDLINAEGKHLGGYIVPGWKMMKEALEGRTQLIRLSETAGVSFLPGVSTEQAVEHGLSACYWGLIQNAVSQLKIQTGVEVSAIIATGGDVKKLGIIWPTLQISEDLVLDGLGYCLT